MVRCHSLGDRGHRVGHPHGTNRLTRVDPSGTNPLPRVDPYGTNPLPRVGLTLLGKAGRRANSPTDPTGQAAATPFWSLKRYSRRSDKLESPMDGLRFMFNEARTERIARAPQIPRLHNHPKRHARVVASRMRWEAVGRTMERLEHALRAHAEGRLVVVPECYRACAEWKESQLPVCRFSCSEWTRSARVDLAYGRRDVLLIDNGHHNALFYPLRSDDERCKVPFVTRLYDTYCSPEVEALLLDALASSQGHCESGVAHMIAQYIV